MTQYRVGIGKEGESFFSDVLGLTRLTEARLNARLFSSESYPLAHLQARRAERSAILSIAVRALLLAVPVMAVGWLVFPR